MGSCFSKRKRGGVAAVTHNTSPRSSFSFSCKGDAAMDPSVLHPHKSVDELVVVVTKDSAPLLAKKSSGKEVRQVQQPNNAHLQENIREYPRQYTGESDLLPSTGKEEKPLQGCHSLLSGSIHNDEKALQGRHSLLSGGAHRLDEKDPQGCHSLLSGGAHRLDEKDLQGPHGHEDSTIEKPLLCSVRSLDSAQVEDAYVLPQSHGVEQGGHSCHDADDRNNQVEGVSLSFGCESAIQGAEIRPSLGKLKRSRSCEETVRSATMRPPRRRSFQETRFNSRASQLETIPESQFGTTKYLEGLDLVDVLPSRSLKIQNPSCIDGEIHNDGNRLCVEFFNLKNQYLSSCSLAYQPDRSDRSPTMAICSNGGDSTEDMTSSFALMHSRASSLDSSEEMEMSSLSPSARPPNISAVAEEEEEEECRSDESETFEFKQAIATHTHVPNQSMSQLENTVKREVDEEDGEGSFKELSVVATGDAVLYASSKSDDFDLIPSKCYMRSSPKQASIPSSAMAASYSDIFHSKLEEDKQLSVDEIISLLESDELDEDVLLSLLNLATTTSHGGKVVPSCHVSDVASEASFEFKVKSSGSTPQSTPSTPMLSAGSTPKRITQLSPLALTPEEIAEIWGVFEQRQAISTVPM